MNSFVKQGLLALSVCVVVFGAMYLHVFKPYQTPQQRQKEIEALPPTQYPFVDQVKMELVLPVGESFVSIVPSNGTGSGYFQLTTQVDRRGELGAKTFKVYSGLMGDRGVMIHQPYLYYTIKEQ